MTEPTKKLIEVAMPLEAINAACKADKDRKTGTIRNLHKWFAPMPVPALRALIFASLVNDPGDDAERARLLELMEKLVASVVDSPPADVLAEARKAIENSVGELPTVLDPFCGGGSTLVEAQRLGLPSRGSDLNPIPVLISKMLTEFPPTVLGKPPLHDFGTRTVWNGLDGFLADVGHYAQRVRDEAWVRIGQNYPTAPNGDPVIAWWWARTVESPDPRFQGAMTPLVSNWWISKHKVTKAFVLPEVNLDTKKVTYQVAAEGEPGAGGKSICMYSGAPISLAYVRQQGVLGNLGLDLIAMMASGPDGRSYHAPTASHVISSTIRRPEVGGVLPLPERALSFSARQYGFNTWNELFTERQTLAIETFADIVGQVHGWVKADGGDDDQARSIATLLGICIGKLAQASSTLVRLFIDSRNGLPTAIPAYARHDVAPLLDFLEVNPFGGSVGDWMQIVRTASRALGYVEPTGPPSQVVQLDARVAASDLTDRCLVVTDPPYFSAIGYANLSDYFYPWVRQALREVFPTVFGTMASPKQGELIAEPARHENKEEAKQYFIDGFTEVFSGLKKASRPDLPMLIVYAYKEQESERESQVSSGWEAMLEAVIRSGHSIVGTWPINGSRSQRMVGVGTNALATYVVLVCRPRAVSAGRVSRRDFTGALRNELGPAIKLLQQAAVAPVDMAQAVIGPGMAVFTRYESVLEAEGSGMTVRSALLLINSVLAEVLDEQEGDLDADTRWALAWFEQFQFGEALSGEADALARAKVTSLDGLERAGIIVTRGGRTRLLPRNELPDDYDPASDLRPTAWEGVQHLAKRFAMDGEQGAADLLAKLPEGDAVRELAYRLYAICERKAWAEEAIAYNGLVASWPEIARIAQASESGRDVSRLPGMN